MSDLVQQMREKARGLLDAPFWNACADELAIARATQVGPIQVYIDILKAERDRLAAEVQTLRGSRAALECSLSQVVNHLKGEKDFHTFSGDYDCEATDLASSVIQERAVVAELTTDAERVNWCVRNSLALDFKYGEHEECVLVIRLPKEGRYPANFRGVIDAARLPAMKLPT